jgi:hypothetical protein
MMTNKDSSTIVWKIADGPPAPPYVTAPTLANVLSEIFETPDLAVALKKLFVQHGTVSVAIPMLRPPSSLQRPHLELSDSELSLLRPSARRNTSVTSPRWMRPSLSNR